MDFTGSLEQTTPFRSPYTSIRHLVVFEAMVIAESDTSRAICNSTPPTVNSNLSRKPLDIGDER
jgi:hypothetical protein